MSVRKRTWKTSKGVVKEAFVVDYVDQSGKRRLKTFSKKGEADRWAPKTAVEIQEGRHTAASASITMAEAGQNWIEAKRVKGLEVGTLDQYRQHVELHINPLMGRDKLSSLTTPGINANITDLLERVSPSMAKKVLTSIKSIITQAQKTGHIAHNPALPVKVETSKRHKRKSEQGRDFPTNEEVRKMIAKASGPFRPLLITAIFTGMRASELRGLRWANVDLDAGLIHVRERMDRYNVPGSPKSSDSDRSIPLSPIVINTLTAWREDCPEGSRGLVFPNGQGNVENLGNIRTRQYEPLLLECEIHRAKEEEFNGQMQAKYDADGKLILRGKYGFHALRHFYASWSLGRKADGGMELPPKTVQERMGHSSITVTMDIYGHMLKPQGGDGAELAEAEKALLAVAS